MSVTDEACPDAPDVAAADPEVSPSPPRWLDALGLAVAPIVVLIVLRVSPYFGLNNGDPFIYVGYSNAFATHVERFGYTYHSVRFGLIFPLRLSMVLGPTWGYFALRYVLYALAIVPMWFVLRPHGRRIAMLGPLLFVANPVVAQAILSTHPDTIVVPGVTLVLCLLVLASRQVSGMRVAMFAVPAGLAAGVTMNANIFGAPVLAIITACACVGLLARRRVLDSFVLGGSVLAGTVAVSVAGMFVYWRLFGDWNIYRTTLKAAEWVAADSMWRSPSVEWMGTRRYIYVPLLVLVFAAASVVRSRRRAGSITSEQALVFSAVAASLGFFVAHQFLLGGNTIETSYYYSYLVGPVMLLLALAVAWSGCAERMPTWLLLVLPILIAYLAQLVDIGRFVVYVVVSVVLVLLSTRATATAVVAVMVAIHLAWGASPRTIDRIEGAGYQYEPHYESSFGNVDDKGFETYLLASQLPAVVPSNADAPVPLLFWYRTFDPQLDSVQATYHWQTSTVQQIPDPGLPSLTPSDIERLRGVVGGYVVMLGSDPSELDAGRSSLLTAGFQLGDSGDVEHFTAGDSEVYVVAVPVIDAPPR